MNKGNESSAGSLPAIGASYFYEDEVYRVGKSGDVEFGMVTENWEMYDSSDSDEDESSRVPNGHVAVTWHPKGKDDVILESKVKLSDRSLMPGDVVRRLIAGKDTQRGYCRNVQVSAAAQILGTKKIITHVLASNLRSVQKMQSDVAVYLDSWIGLVRDMRYRIGLRFPDNSACLIDSFAISEYFEDTRQSADGFGNGDTFYPGQKLRGQMKYLRDADWSVCSDDLKRAKDRKQVSAIVTTVSPSAVNVQWQWQTPESPLEKEKREKPERRNSGCSKHPPPSLITGDDLTRITCLNLFDSCTVQLGDISFYNPSGKDVIVEKGDWKKLVAASIHEPLKTRKSQSILKIVGLGGDGKNNNEEMIGIPEHTVATTDSDSNMESGKTNSGTQLTKDKDVLHHKKSLPKVSTRALRKKKLKKSHKQPKLHVVAETEVVVETIHTTSSVDVVWQDGTIEENMMSIELYPIHHLDDHEFFPGDFVVRAESTEFRIYGVIQNMDHSGRVAVVKWFQAYTFEGEQRPTELSQEEMSVYDIKDHPDFRFRPGTIVIRVANILPTQHSAGQILDNYPDGQVRVWWTNDVTSSCWPQDLFRLGDYDSDEGEMWDDHGNASDNECDDVNSDSSWETEAEEELPESTDPAQLSSTIGKLLEQIQSSLVGTRESIIASAPVSMSEDGVVVSNTNLYESLDRRGITKKLLLIFKDCQYLDKMMGTKFFDEKVLKDWFKEMESACKGGQMLEQVKRFFEVSPLEKSTSSSFNLKEGGSGIVVVKIPSASSRSSSVNDVVSTLAEAIHENQSDQRVSDEVFCSQTMVVSELCSVILNKLVAAHSEYETRFGSVIAAAEGDKSSSTGDSPNLSSIPEEGSPKQTGTVETGTAMEAKEKMDFSCGPMMGLEEVVRELGKAADGGPKEKEDELAAAAVEKKTSHFTLVEGVPDTHRYRLTTLQPQNQRQFLKTVKAEVSKLKENLPAGIQFKGYEDRMDLYSVMISGPENTPYEDGIFLFDIQLPPTYPDAPPLVHYVSFCPDRLNPNLYECGKVCVSLLGTWSGRGTEVWTSESSLLQLLVSIQGLILVPEPYYNEAGYEKQRGSQQGLENSRMYNEMVLIKLVQSMSRMLANPHSPWEEEITRHIQLHGPRMIKRYRDWLMISEKSASLGQDSKGEDFGIGQPVPGFPLLPVSKGFSITLRNTLDNFAKQCTPSTPTASGPVGFGFAGLGGSSSNTSATSAKSP